MGDAAPSLDRNQLRLILERELAFLEDGGYRRAPWSVVLFFEDSPTCPRTSSQTCIEARCPLPALADRESYAAPSACRFIPLGNGENLNSLYRTATREELETTVRKWLVDTIRQLGPK